MMTNPFFHRGPINESKFYFPRPKETRQILRLLATAQNCSVIGPVKSGKTSLLIDLGRPETLSAHGLSPSHYSVIYLSFEGLGNLTVERFFYLMVHELARRTGGKMALVWPQFEPRGAISFLELEEIINQLEVAGERLVFCLDEMELAADNPAFDLNFFSALRHIASRPGVCFVTATERRLHELKIANREVGSPFADLFSVVRLRPLDQQSAWESVQKLALEAGMDLASERDLILELGGGWPYHLQIVAYEVCECKFGASALKPEEQIYARTLCYDQLEPVLSMLWERLSEGERQAAIASLTGGGAKLEVPELTILENGSAHPVNDLVAEFLSERSRDYDVRPQEYLKAESTTPDRQMMYGMVRTLVRAVESRDFYAQGHADRVTRLATAIAQEMGCQQELTDSIRIAARLHDIGYVSISDVIRLKPGAVNELETEIIRTHPLVGAQILDAFEFPWLVKPSVRFHHERLDGSGYPEGLMGDEIPVGARVVAVADVFAAMTSDRPYRSARTEEETLAELKINAGAKYDFHAVAALERVLQRGLA